MHSLNSLKIEVTQENIDNGVRQNCEYCPIAQAVTKALKLQQSDYVTVSMSYINVSVPWNPPQWYDNTDEMKNFIWDFDRGVTVYPVCFLVEEMKEVACGTVYD